MPKATEYHEPQAPAHSEPQARQAIAGVLEEQSPAAPAVQLNLDQQRSRLVEAIGDDPIGQAILVFVERLATMEVSAMDTILIVFEGIRNATETLRDALETGHQSNLPIPYANRYQECRLIFDIKERPTKPGSGRTAVLGVGSPDVRIQRAGKDIDMLSLHANTGSMAETESYMEQLFGDSSVPVVVSHEERGGVIKEVYTNPAYRTQQKK